MHILGGQESVVKEDNILQTSHPRYLPSQKPALTQMYIVTISFTFIRYLYLQMYKLGLGRISGSDGEHGRISGNIQQGMPDNPVGYPASGKKKSDPAQP